MHNQLRSDRCDVGAETRPTSSASPILKITAASMVLIGSVATVAIWPDAARDAASRTAEFLSGLSGSRAGGSDAAEQATTSTAERSFRPTKAQLTSFGIITVQVAEFRPEGLAEGRIALNEDENVPVYSPYAGRVTKIAAKAGDDMKAGQPLFTVEVADMVQAQNDFQSAINALNKAQEQLKLNQIIAARQQVLYQAKAAALKDYQSAENDVISAQSSKQTAEVALEAVRNRLRILGKTDAEIAAFQKNSIMSPETVIRAPIGGTVVQRKVGLGQYLSTGSDPVFTIGNLSTVWLIANARESDIPRIRLGQPAVAIVNGFGDRVFKARVTYMAASLDPATRRLAVRCEVENPDRELKPEMFARFAIVTGDAVRGPAVPASAVVREGDRAHVWVLRPDGAIEAREIELGLRNDAILQVIEGLQTGEQIVSRGALFIDRATNG
ncbi:efflux RND transporter periplasmic adaptor subunit [Methylobacterium sp. DCY52]|jgi:membrane fusion protein, heavy metal efflux system|uniref:efflux RND transporter periplasmic adaptor subunit n=1 Tax=Methylobacterium sp. DCY52 TaxID=739139 RepID=UPI00314528D3